MAVFEVDAVVVGGGHHGLVAAAVLADAGWDVLLLEAQPELGGAVRSTEWHPGFVADRFSAFYPLAAASPVLRALELERHGLSWAHAPAVLAHPLRPDGTAAAVLHRDPERTAAALDAHHPGDGAAWLELCRQWRAVEEPLLRSMFTTFPPVRGPAQLLRRIGAADALELLRFLLLPATRMGEERFGGAAARLLIAGNAAHTDVPVTAPGSGLYGLVLAMVGQHHGFPTPVGGTGELTAALARRAESAGTVHLGADVDGLVRWGADLETGTLPSSPFLLLGQMTTADPTRSPAGTESVWAYTHLPRGWSGADEDELARRVEAVVEAHAPGFGDRILHRTVLRPADLLAADANLGHGAVGGGTSHLFQQLVFRPVPGLGRPETPIERLYLGSAAAHPGGGVHGVCGFLAAKAALAADGRAGFLRRKISSAALALVHGSP